MYRFLLISLTLLTVQNTVSAQDSIYGSYKNQVFTNLLLPILSSIDLNYERTLGGNFAIGVGGAIYGDTFQDLSFDDSYRAGELTTKYEITPFTRLYFNGNQNNSHILEIFGSISGVEESGRYIRSVNPEGFGVYDIGVKSFTRGGFGMGYAYRFLFMEGKLVAEAQLGLRTNFDVSFVVVNAALVRTGIKIGYRF